MAIVKAPTTHKSSHCWDADEKEASVAIQQWTQQIKALTMSWLRELRSQLLSAKACF
jgi:hypothetical protein